ncbi:MAG: ABC transporter substrate-binding protein [Acidobacteriota bacterium]
MRHKTLRLCALLGIQLCLGCRQNSPVEDTRTFVLVQSDDILGLSPNRSMEWHTSGVLSNVYESLVVLDANMKLLPALAESWESPDKLTWRFHIRHGVAFHGGRTLAAQDVKYSIEDLLAAAPEEYSNLLRAVGSVEAVDHFTVDIKTTSPVRLLNELCYVSIVPAGWTLGDDGRPPPGTGPYRVAEWKRGERLRMEAVPGYWGGEPAVKRALMLIVPDADERVRTIVGGRADMIADPPRARIAELMAQGNLTLLTRRGLLVIMMVFDLGREQTPGIAGKNPLLDIRVRQAINLAIDRQAIIEGTLHGYGTEATQLLPPDVFGYDDKVKNLPRDPGTAKQLLAKAGYTNGFKVVMHVRDIRLAVAQALKEQLKEIGVELDVRSLNGRDFHSTMVRGESSLVIIGWSCDAGDGQSAFDFCFWQPPNAKETWMGNMGGYRDPDMHAILAALHATIDQRERLSLLERAGEIVTRDLPVLPLYVEDPILAITDKYRYEPRADGKVSLFEVRPR